MSGSAPDQDRADRAPPSVFLGRPSYRRRRLMDAARLLPVFGAMLFAVPLLWPVPDPTGPDQNGVVPMSDAILYIFGAWSVLIVTIALFGVGARLWTGNESPHGPGQD